MKHCMKCDTTKPETSFGNLAARKNGLDYRCKECRQQDCRDYRLKNKEDEDEWLIQLHKDEVDLGNFAKMELLPKKHLHLL